MASAVFPEGVALTSAVPDEVSGPVEVAFQLPGEIEVVRCRARASEVVVGQGHEEHRERRELRFLDLDAAQRARIERYLVERAGRA